MNPWSAYDRIAGIYDEDMGLNNPGRDIGFYSRLASRVQGPVLELGCGTGRVALPLVEAGFHVVGLDASLPMLLQLRRKAQERLSACTRRNLGYHCADMRRFALRRTFGLILCPFSGFTYLLENADQTAALSLIREHLAPGGRFALDVFLHRREFLSTSDRHVFHDYRRKRCDGTFLERTKTIRKDKTRRINEVCRRYAFLGKDETELRSFTTVERIRYFCRRELKFLLAENGFSILEEYGGFDGEPYRSDCQVMVFVCGARRARRG